jgi:FixJ family two-component response regulator
MPKMIGVDLAAKLLTARPQTKVAFMSGYSEYVRENSEKRFAGAPVLQKPFSPASLVGLVREALWGVPHDREAVIEEAHTG